MPWIPQYLGLGMVQLRLRGLQQEGRCIRRIFIV
jgi:hypothetical protein